jgi:arabinose-5-phosphate isomerase
MNASPKTKPQTDDLAIARRVIETEIAGLKDLSAALGPSFAEAVNVIDAMRNTRRGRLIIAGIGKSGHIAKKIVATLASTGTPSHFVHAGEASHGDLGMITEFDVVLMISNSGGSPELSDLIAYTRRFRIPLIAMTSNQDSALAKHADILLLLPKSPEACPNGLAPTTSTTMTLALGDALSVALLERMGLTPEQFGVFHPGGKLGQKLITVSEIMHKKSDLPLVDDTANMDAAILALTSKNLGCALVTDKFGKLSGLITDGDLKRHMSPDLLQKPVASLMTRNPRTIVETALAAQAVEIMTRTPGQYITSLIVTDGNGDLAGLIRLQDCLQKGVA